MSRILLATLALLCAGSALATTSALAEHAKPATEKPAAPQSDEDEGPQPTALTVGAMEMGDDQHVAVVSMSIEIAANRVAYSYGLKNAGTAALSLAASVSMPSLAASNDDSETWELPFDDAENPVGLKISVGGENIETKPHASVKALGLNHFADLKAAHAPLLPFGAATDKALRELPPDVAASFAQMGLMSPRDPSKSDEAPSAGWTLDVVREFQIKLPANTVTPVKATFTPIKAEYPVDKGDEESLDELKDDYCISAKSLAALHARLKSRGSWRAIELSIDVDGPSGFLEMPAIALSVQKPRADAIVAFCGANEKSQGLEIVTGTVPEDNDNGELRIVIFSPADV
ncbi:DUF4424 family protein [Methylocapsa acidiphila]|uniref:DUF4424 family protein n=1 Tax=Methylocapsa acidiphila TaxID=133552 RepID=UPI0003F8485A|nr:DUF4424 family protein [Methylocapsa acidiphila]